MPVSRPRRPLVTLGRSKVTRPAGRNPQNVSRYSGGRATARVAPTKMRKPDTAGRQGCRPLQRSHKRNWQKTPHTAGASPRPTWVWDGRAAAGRPYETETSPRPTWQEVRVGRCKTRGRMISAPTPHSSLFTLLSPISQLPASLPPEKREKVGFSDRSAEGERAEEGKICVGWRKEI